MLILVQTECARRDSKHDAVPFAGAIERVWPIEARAKCRIPDSG